MISEKFLQDAVDNVALRIGIISNKGAAQQQFFDVLRQGIHPDHHRGLTGSKAVQNRDGYQKFFFLLGQTIPKSGFHQCLDTSCIIQ
ncbi:hypothetical protein SDC9_140050 [bioreactor metagenome]|uniref:Uncharacterized protein n=1 Tax=bioreactor metagenome TaxID=1076179 RepID=A0A645DTS7_9ZZZZ